MIEEENNLLGAEEKGTKKKLPNGMDAEKMIERNTDKGTKIRYNDRVKLEILKDTQFYKKGQIIEPHRVMAEQLIEEKTAKEVR